MHPSSKLHAWTMAGVFVLLWASGYVVARLAAPHSTPLAFLALRFLLTVLLLVPMALLARARWPDRVTATHLIVSGLLVHAGYLGGVWCAIKLGMPAGVAALIVNLQPILTAMGAGWLGERSTSSRCSPSPRSPGHWRTSGWTGPPI